MDTKLIAGKAWGVPIGGTIINLNDADLKYVLSTAAGFAKALFKFSAGTVLSLGFLGCYLLLRNSWFSSYTFDTLVKIKTSKQNFKGICNNNQLSFVCNNNRLTIPITYITDIREYGFPITEISLFDGSSYTIHEDDNENLSLDFISIAGFQKIGLFSNNLKLTGTDIKEVDVMKNNMISFLERKEQNIHNILGKELMEKFFYPGQ